MKLLWIHVPGLDADATLGRIRVLPSFRKLLKRGSIGYCNLNSVAFADVAEHMILRRCSELNLPWQSGLALDQSPHSIVRCISEMPFRASIVSMNRGPSQVPNHVDVFHEDLSLAWANVVMSSMQMREQESELLFIELAGMEQICADPRSSMLPVFDATIRELTEGLDENVHILLTSPYSLHKYPVTFSLSKYIEEGDIRPAGLRVSGDYGLIELDNSEEFETFKRWLYDYQFSNGVEPIADVQLSSRGGRHFVQVYPFRGVGFSQYSREIIADGIELASYGIMLLAGPRVRTGVLTNIDWIEIPELVLRICTCPEVLEQEYPYFGEKIGPDMLSKFIWGRYE